MSAVSGVAETAVAGPRTAVPAERGDRPARPARPCWSTPATSGWCAGCSPPGWSAWPLATPAALAVATSAPVATVSLFLLTISSLVFSRSDRLIRMLIRHPLLASLDTAVSIALLISGRAPASRPR